MNQLASLNIAKRVLFFMLLFSFSFLTDALLYAQEPDSSSNIFQLREAEKKFARESVMFGVKTAFINNLANESIAFTNKWITNNLEFWKDYKSNPFVLKWEPEFVDISKSGDFGFSTGPYEVQEYRPYTNKIASGYYISVWEKQSGGIWKVIYDQGSNTPAHSNYDHKFYFPEGSDKPIRNTEIVETDKTCKDLLEKEKQFMELWEKDPSFNNYYSFFAPDVRFQQQGHIPTTNSDTIETWINKLDKKLIWIVDGSKAAKSGDMGFTYGYVATQKNPDKHIGHYARFWKKQASGKWSILIELLNLE